MARLLFAAFPLVVLLVLLQPSPPAVSAVTVGDILSSAAGLWRSDSTVADSSDKEAKDEIGEKDVSKDEAIAGEDLNHDGQLSEPIHPEQITTVYTTRTEYIKITSTKTQIPMCVTAYKPLPQCSKDPYDPPYESWRTARMTTSNEVFPETDALERVLKISQESSEVSQKEVSKRSGRLMMGHLMKPITRPLEMLGMLPKLPSLPAPQFHFHMEMGKKMHPLDPESPIHPLNPANIANLVDLLNGVLQGGVGLAGSLAGRRGIGGGGGEGGGFGPGFRSSGFYDGVYVEVVKEVNTITNYETKTKGSYTATLTAGYCMPASDTVPHCKPTADYNNYHAYQPYYNPDMFYGIPNYQYDRYYADPWSLTRGQPEGASLLDSTVTPSTSSIVPESASQITPPLKSQD